MLSGGSPFLIRIATHDKFEHGPDDMIGLFALPYRELIKNPEARKHRLFDEFNKHWSRVTGLKAIKKSYGDQIFFLEETIPANVPRGDYETKAEQAKRRYSLLHDETFARIHFQVIKTFGGRGFIRKKDLAKRSVEERNAFNNLYSKSSGKGGKQMAASMQKLWDQYKKDNPNHVPRPSFPLIHVFYKKNGQIKHFDLENCLCNNPELALAEINSRVSGYITAKEKLPFSFSETEISKVHEDGGDIVWRSKYHNWAKRVYPASSPRSNN